MDKKDEVKGSVTDTEKLEYIFRVVRNLRDYSKIIHTNYPRVEDLYIVLYEDTKFFRCISGGDIEWTSEITDMTLLTYEKAMEIRMMFSCGDTGGDVSIFQFDHLMSMLLSNFILQHRSAIPAEEIFGS